MNKKAMIIGGAVLGLGAIVVLKKGGSISALIKGGAVKAKPPVNSLGATGNVSQGSQPWYNQAKGFIVAEAGAGAAQAIKNPTAALNNAGSVVHSISSVWGDVSSYFGGSSNSGDSAAPVDGETSTVASPDAVPPDQMGADSTLTGSEVDQSNLMGDMQNQAIDSGSSDGVTADDTWGDTSSDASMADVGLDNSDYSAY